MQAVSDPPLRLGPVHSPVERATADGKTMIRCAGTRCASWNPRPFPSRREAEFWYDRHIRQPLTHQLWLPGGLLLDAHRRRREAR